MRRRFECRQRQLAITPIGIDRIHRSEEQRGPRNAVIQASHHRLQLPPLRFREIRERNPGGAAVGRNDRGLADFFGDRDHFRQQFFARWNFRSFAVVERFDAERM